MTSWLPAPAAPAQVQAGPPPDAVDGRAVVLAACAWLGALVALFAGRWVLLVAVGAVLAGVAVVGRALRRTRAGDCPTGLVLTGALVALATGVTAYLEADYHRTGPVARLADEQAWVTVTAAVVSDPVQREGRFEDFTLTRLRTVTVTGFGVRHRTTAPVLVIGDLSWLGVRLGDSVEVAGRLEPAEDPATAGVLLPARSPDRSAASGPSGVLLDGAAHIRQGIRDAVARGNPDARALVPALVVGDDQQLSPTVVADFRTTGLTHLAAVSGTNLTLVVGFLLVLARWGGVRGRGLIVVGVLGVLGFVLLARTEPSVVRAAAMGSVALLGLGSHGRRQGGRALGVAVVVLLLVDPLLAVSWGFGLSVLATAGIVFLAARLRDAMMRWLPRWVAEAVAVPLAAQLATTPAVAVLSGQVSLVAVMANILVAGAVGPATVLGLLGGLLMLVVPPLGLAVGTVAAACGGWIVLVATRLARLPTAALDWSSGPGGLLLLTVLCLLLAWLGPRLLSRPGRTAAVTALLMVVVVVPVPSPGWPPSGWVMVACDVGQGDALVLAAGDGRAVVVDAGPDPAVVSRCLGRLGIREVPLVVLTHFHADHVDGLPGVLEGRAVGEIVVSALPEPASGAASVRSWAGASGVPVREAALGETGRLGALRWQVVGPVRLPVTGTDAGEGEGSAANDASVVLLLETHGIRVLLGGDMEPAAQESLHRAVPGLHADVLKVSHHGSAAQDPALIGSLGARLAVVSVAADNDYGHPAPETLALLEAAGMTVARTDESGDVAVRVVDGEVRVSGRGDASGP